MVEWVGKTVASSVVHGVRSPQAMDAEERPGSIEQGGG
jgi:hypothetical protein